MPSFSPFIRAASPSPVMEARRWIDGVTFAPDLPLVNLSQAAPVAPPPQAMRTAMAEMVMRDDATHLYGPVLGLPDLRAEIATRWSTAYGGAIEPADVAVTAGCNQAFCAAMATLAGSGDAVLLPVPWYFNHKMWLDMAGVEAVPLPCDAAMIPDLDAARALMGPRVKAIVLVTPNNPTGAEYDAATVAAFADLARTHGAALVLDETYRDFDARGTRPHDLFADPGWREVLVHLYSFSKAYRLTGHRVGAMIADPARLAEVEKFLDTTTICPPQLGQRAALWGLGNLGDWVAGERIEILARRDAIAGLLADLPGWRLRGCGAYFAYVEHDFIESAEALAQRLVRDAAILMLPGTMFAPARTQGGDGAAERQMRIAFANVDAKGLGVVVQRLRGVRPAALASDRASA